ncbi:MAG: hypothetical protein GXO79_11870 [Chlorobi bacterium]|nr:hypothetical protein [Chlorobiota bacterium]
MFLKNQKGILLVLILTCINLLLFSFNSFSQGDISVDLIKKYAENSFKNKDYEFALENYSRLYLIDEKNINYNYRLGICYTESNRDKAAAIPYLEYVISFNNFPEKALYYLGRAYMYNYLFTDAVEVFYEYKIIGKDEKVLKEVNRLIEMCYYALEIMNNPVPVTFQLLDSTINTPFDDYNPFITDDGEKMVFTSNRKYVKEYEEYYNSGYIAEKKKSKWGSVKELSSNTLEDKAETVGFTYEGNDILLHLDGYNSDNDIKVAKKKGREYYYAFDELSKAINTEYIEDGACMTADEKTVYFASDRPGGFGGMDIYVTHKQQNGTWSKPENLGNVINTEYDENFPNVTSDGKTMYFSSKGFQGIGGYDIFESAFSSETQKWQRPRSIGFPINTPDDNTTIAMSSDKKYAYIAANRKEGFGGLDIYKITLDKENVTATTIIAGTIYIGTKDNYVPYSGDIMKVGVTILDKYGNIYAKYKVDPDGGTFFPSLTPGEYKLVIEGAGSEVKYSENLVITGAEGDLIMKEVYITR